MTAVSAVVVHFRGGAELERCVASCLDVPEIVETVVVDNEGVAARIRERFRAPRVRVLAMRSNVGYGRAANAGLAASRGEAVLVLNQDVVVSRGAVAAMLDAGRDSGAWVVGSRIVDASGREAPEKDGFPAPLDWPGEAASGDAWHDAPWVAGAALLLMPGHTELRFDPRIFMYGEDEELCWRVWRDGGRVVMAERAHVVHTGGTATRARWSRREIAGRTVWNRARFVRWHAGWWGAARFLVEASARRAGRVSASATTASPLDAPPRP